MINLSKIRKAKEETRTRANNERNNNLTKYTVIKSKGKIVDIRLGFGSYCGNRIRDMVDDPRSANYIRNFLLNKDVGFPERFRTLVKRAFERYYDDFLEDDIPY